MEGLIEEMVEETDMATQRDLPKNVYRIGKTGRYEAKVGRWYFLINLGRFDTPEEASAAVDRFHAEFGHARRGPKGDHDVSLSNIFCNYSRTITLRRFREVRKTLLYIAEQEQAALLA
jgi:hypothetical protein